MPIPATDNLNYEVLVHDGYGDSGIRVVISTR